MFDVLVEGFWTFVQTSNGVTEFVQLAVHRNNVGLGALFKGYGRQQAEQDEASIASTGVPYTIVRPAALRDEPGGQLGFEFVQVGRVTIFFCEMFIWMFVNIAFLSSGADCHYTWCNERHCKGKMSPQRITLHLHINTTMNYLVVTETTMNDNHVRFIIIT